MLIAGGQTANAVLSEHGALRPSCQHLRGIDTGNERRAFCATATLLPNGKVLIAGGDHTCRRFFSSTELYDPAANTFAATTPVMNVAHCIATETLLPNGKVLIAGGLIGRHLSAARICTHRDRTLDGLHTNSIKLGRVKINGHLSPA